MKERNLKIAVELADKKTALANTITALEISEDIQVRVFTKSRQEFVINAHVSQENLKRVLLAESQKALENYKRDLLSLGVET